MREMVRQVRGSGPYDAQIIILGASPSREDIAKGIPFVGPAGRLLRKKLMSAGIPETSVRFENVIEHAIASDRELYSEPEVPTPKFLGWIEDAKERLAAFKSAKVIVPLGDTALFTLTKQTGIDTHQSSVIWDAGPFPIVPAYDPAYVLRCEMMGSRFKDEDTSRMRTASSWLVFALSKAAEFTQPTPPRYQKRTYLIEPATLEVVKTWTDRALATQAPISVDIELFHGELTCIGFATSPTEAMTIPLSVAGAPYWGDDPAIEVEVWKLIAALVGSENLKIFQNAIFDILWLSRFGIAVNGPLHDTMLTAGILHAEMEKGLDSLAKMYTYTPAWKNHKDWGAFVDPKALWHYNATDTALTYEIWERQQSDLVTDPSLANLYQRTMELFPYVYAMCARGWNIDHASLKRISADMEIRLATITAEITALIGTEFNPRSHLQVKEQLQKMGCKIPIKDGKETSGRRALLKLKEKHPENALIPALLKHAKIAKLSSTYSNVILDPDGRLRFTVNMSGTKSGRFSSSQSPWGTGLNSQNIPSRDPESPFSIRHIVIADPGLSLLQVDLSQAEARVVAWLANEETLIRIFADGGDVHTRTACMIFNEDITLLPEGERKRKRYLGKKTVHCLTVGHEVLTDHGIWLPIEEWTDEPIAVWDSKTLRIHFEIPKNYVQERFTGTLVTYKGQSASFEVTDNHRLPIRTNSENPYRQVLAKDLKRGRLATVGNYDPTCNYQVSKSDIDFAIAVQADGSWAYNTVRFHFTKHRKINRLLNILKDTGALFEWVKCSDHPDGVRITVKNIRHIDGLIRGSIGPYGVCEKVWDPYWLMNISIENRLHWLNELTFWDGYRNPESNVRTYLTKVFQNASTVQTIAHITGHQAQLNKTRDGIYKVSLNRRKDARIECGQLQHEQTEFEPVYCFETSTGYFLIRHEGKISVTHNSANYGMHEKTFAEACLDDGGISITVAEASGLLNRYFTTFSRIRLFQASIRDEVRRSRTLVSPYGRRRAFHGKLDDNLYREAYSFLPQAIVLDTLNTAWLGCEKAFEALRRGEHRVEVIQQGHDSILLQASTEKLTEVIEIIRSQFSGVWFKINNVDRQIPFDISVGPNWRDLKEIKQ